MRLPDFNKLFEDGRRVNSADFGPVTLRLHEAGHVVLTTGRVVACDPLVAPETEAYTVALPPGRHRLVLSVADFDDGDQRVAGAMLRVGDSEPAAWEMALLPGEDVAALGEDEIFGFGVDSATACLMDAAAARAVAVLQEANAESFFQLVEDEMEKSYVDTWSWAEVVLDEASGLNVVTYSTGLGDGLYASYFGRDASGEVCRLVTDFALFDFEELA
jgi:hypothetical protein